MTKPPTLPRASLYSICRDWFAGLFPGDLLIRHRPGTPVRVSGSIPRSKVPAIVAFFGRDLPVDRSVTVKGTRTERAWRWRIGGDLDGGDVQRVRNFLTDHLP